MPAKSKTKCIFFCGRTGDVRYPEPVKLNGKDLPWVEHEEHLGRTLQDDPISTTCRNLRYLGQMTGLQKDESFSNWRVKDALGMKKVPENEKWRLGLLTTLLSMRQDKYTNVLDSKQLTAMIDSLSST